MTGNAFTKEELALAASLLFDFVRKLVRYQEQTDIFIKKLIVGKTKKPFKERLNS